MARKKKTPTVRLTVKLSVSDEQALRSAAETLERDPSWVLGKLCHLTVGATDLSVGIRRWLRGDTAWDAGLPGDQQALCTIENEDPPVAKVERRKTVAQAPPTQEEVAAYVRGQAYSFDPAEFHTFYTANGWVQGRAGKPLLDWRAAAKNWQIAFAKRSPTAAAVTDWGKNRPAEADEEPAVVDDRTADLIPEDEEEVVD